MLRQAMWSHTASTTLASRCSAWHTSGGASFRSITLTATCGLAQQQQQQQTQQTQQQSQMSVKQGERTLPAPHLLCAAELGTHLVVHRSGLLLSLPPTIGISITGNKML
jgi:hypothetical protein